MPNAGIYSVYGSSEAEPIAHIELFEITESDFAHMQTGKGLLAGLPVKEIKLATLPDNFGSPIGEFTEEEFEKEKLSSNMIGEIVVSGDHVLKEYIGGINLEGIKFKIGEEIWHRTGDAGYVDKEGRLWLVGRCNAKVSIEGNYIYPFSIETAAMSYPNIKHVAFVQKNGVNILVAEPLINKNIDIGALSKIQYVDEVRTMKIPMDKRHNSKTLYDNLIVELQ